MNLTEKLLSVSSKREREQLAQLIINDKSEFKKLNSITISDAGKASDKAAWVLRDVIEQRPEWSLPCQEGWVEAIKANCSDAIKRNLMGLFQEVPIDKSIEGDLFELSERLTFDPSQAVAVRAFSMTVMTRLSLEYPELQSEVVESLKVFKDAEKAALRARSRMMIKKLKKAIDN